MMDIVSLNYYADKYFYPFIIMYLYQIFHCSTDVKKSAFMYILSEKQRLCNIRKITNAPISWPDSIISSLYFMNWQSTGSPSVINVILIEKNLFGEFSFKTLFRRLHLWITFIDYLRLYRNVSYSNMYC